MEKINHLAVHWVDGMKISKREFNALENYIADQVRDTAAISLTDYNFGLLPAPETGREPLSVDVSSERVELYFCRAITRAGARIEIVDLSDAALRNSVRELMGNFDYSHAQEWYIALRVNPFERVPYGKLSAETNTHQSTIPRYELTIMPKEQTNSVKIAAFAIPIAKIRGSVGGIEQVKNYIPPCAVLNASPELLRIHQRLEQDLSDIFRKSVLIVRKVNYRRSRENISALAADIGQVSQQTMEFLNQNYDTYRLLLPSQPPVMLVEYFARLARTVDTSLELTRGKDDMLSYFQQYVQGFNFNEFGSTIQAMTANLTYNHLEIRNAFDRVEAFVTQLKNLFEGLDRLNYEQLPRFDIVTGTRTVNDPYNTPPPRNTGQQQEQRPSVGGLKIKSKDSGPDQGNETDNPWGVS